VNTRRSARHHSIGARLSDKTGTVSTRRSRADAQRDALRSNAFYYIGR
jgi:hypothetical protein